MEHGRKIPLTDLPLEIVLEILEKSTRLSLSQVSRVNKKLQDLAQYVLEHKKKLRLCGDHLRVLMLSAPSKYDLVELDEEVKVYNGLSKQVPRTGIISNMLVQGIPNRIYFPHANHFQNQTVTVQNGGTSRRITITQVSNLKQFRTKMFLQAFSSDLCVLVMDPSDIDENAEQIKDLVFGSSFMMSARNIIVTIDLHRPEVLKQAQHLFNESRSKISKLLDRTVGPCYKIIPVNAKTGTNVYQASPSPASKFEWYSGPTLNQLILEDQLRTNFEQVYFDKLCDKPLLVQVSAAYRILGIGTVALGRVVSGTMKPGDTLRFNPRSLVTEVKSIESGHEMVREAKPGNCIGFNVKNLSRRDIYDRYCYVVDPKTSPPVKSTLAFRASLVVMKPDRFVQHQIYNVFYGPSRIRCLLWWIFPEDGKNHDRSERKFKISAPNSQPFVRSKPRRGNYRTYPEFKAHLDEYRAAVKKEKEANVLAQAASATTFERPPIQKRKKATAILLPLVHYDIETYKPTEFEKNHRGKVMMVEKGSIVSVGRVDRVLNVSHKEFQNRGHRKQYDHVIKAGSELFNLPEESNLHQLFVDHVKTNDHAKSSILKTKPMSPSW